MIMYLHFVLKQCVLFFALFAVYQVGEIIARHELILENLILRCFVDNSCHIIIGIISWLIVACYDKLTLPHLLQSLLCGFFAGIIDIDHFLMTRSFLLKDAVNLSSRPLFHNTTLMISLITCFTFFAHKTGQYSIENIGWILMVAVISHHLRDSLRRGLWLWPVSTKALNFYDCIVLSFLFPLAVGSFIKILSHPSPKDKTILNV